MKSEAAMTSSERMLIWGMRHWAQYVEHHLQYSYCESMCRDLAARLSCVEHRDALLTAWGK